MLFSHDELNNIFLYLDKDSEILRCEYQGWLVWPIVKERLWHSSLQMSCGLQNKKKYGFNKIKCFIFGAVEFVINLYSGNYNCLLAYTPSSFLTNEGKKRHVFFGNIISTQKKLFQIIYQPAHENKLTFRRGLIHEAYLGTFLNILSLLLIFNKEINFLSKQISLFICKKYPIFSDAVLKKNIKRSLSIFYVKKLYYGFIFKNLKIKKCLVQDPDAKCGEVAAAKQHAIEVIEIQHGMFSCNEPDYSWDERFLQLKTKMTVPHKILVLGKLWKDMLIKNKFWQKNEVHIIDYPALSYYRILRAKYDNKSNRDKKALTLLFPTQYYIRVEAIKLLRNFLYLLTKKEKFQCQILIKIHPAEKNYVEYTNLANEFPDFCKILGSQNSVLELMVQEVDVVIGYTSMVLLESLGLGIPIVSLKGGHASQGLIEIFNLGLLEQFVPQCSNAEELYEILEEMLNNADHGKKIQGLWEKLYGDPEVSLLEMVS